MSQKFLLLWITILSLCMPLYATITSVDQALKIAGFLDALEKNYQDAFRNPKIKYALEELLAFYEESQEFSATERAALFNKLHRYFNLVDKLDTENGPATKFLNDDQTLVTYWTQVVNQTLSILDQHNDEFSNAVNITANPSTSFDYTYTLYMPLNQGSEGQVLSTDGNNPAQLSWITTITADVSLIYSATSCDRDNTIVLRDVNGSFVATNIALTGDGSNSIINYSTTPCGPGNPIVSIPNASTIELGNPAITSVVPSNNLMTSFGSASAAWSTVNTGTVALYDQSGFYGAFAAPSSYNGNSYTLTMPITSAQGQYQVLGNVSATGSSEQLGWITTVTSSQAINLVYTATSCDNQNTLVLRDQFGNFVANTITLNGSSLINYGTSLCGTGSSIVSVTDGGTTIVLGNAGVTNVNPFGDGTISLGESGSAWNALNTYTTVYYDPSGNTISIAAPTSGLVSSYEMLLPTSQGMSGQVLSTDGQSPANLSWINTVTSQQAINLLYSATSCDRDNTLVVRDQNGSFVATNIALKGDTNNSLINYSYLGACDTGSSILSVLPGGATITLGNAGVTNVNPAEDGTISLGSSSFIWNAINTYTTNYYSGSNAVSVAASPATTASYEIYWPNAAGMMNTVLTNPGGSSPQQLTWTPVSSLVSGTPCDSPNMTVSRDGAGSFAATSIALGAGADGVLLTFPSVLNGCSYGNTFLAAPGTDNIFLGVTGGSASVSGSENIAFGTNALNAIVGGAYNTAIGVNALELMSSGSYNVALGEGAGSANVSGSNNIYVGAGVTGGSSDNALIYIGSQGVQNATYIAGITNNTLNGDSLVAISNSGQLGITNIITTLTITQSLYVDSLNGAVIAMNGLLTATIGVDGTRLASFPLTDTPAVNFYQPIEPSRELYFLDDFLAFNNTSGDMFYGDTPWAIGNNTSTGPSPRVSPQPATVTNGALALGITRLSTSQNPGSSNYLTKQLNGASGLDYALTFSQQTGYCLNEWRVALPSTSTTNTYTAYVGLGDNPTTAPQNGIFFAFDPLVGAWTINTANAGNVTSVTTSNTPTAGIFQRLGFQVNSGGSSVNFFIDDMPVGTGPITSNIPQGGTLGSSGYCGPFASIVKTAAATTGGASFDLDYWYLHYTFNTRR